MSYLWRLNGGITSCRFTPTCTPVLAVNREEILNLNLDHASIHDNVKFVTFEWMTQSLIVQKIANEDMFNIHPVTPSSPVVSLRETRQDKV